jgi:hypothetical protein
VNIIGIGETPPSNGCKPITCQFLRARRIIPSDSPPLVCLTSPCQPKSLALGSIMIMQGKWFLSQGPISSTPQGLKLLCLCAPRSYRTQWWSSLNDIFRLFHVPTSAGWPQSKVMFMAHQCCTSRSAKSRQNNSLPLARVQSTGHRGISIRTTSVLKQRNNIIPIRLGRRERRLKCNEIMKPQPPAWT